MLEGTHYVECACDSAEHVLRFTINGADKELYLETQLNPYLPWYKRAWRALRYTFGYQCRYGHWENTTFNANTVLQLRDVLIEYDRITNTSN